MPRDCTGVRKLLMMYSPGRMSGIQYNMLRQQSKKVKSGASIQTRASRRAVGTLDSTTTTQRAFMPAAVSVAMGVRKSAQVVLVRRREVCCDVVLASGAFNITTTLTDASRRIHPGNAVLFP